MDVKPWEPVMGGHADFDLWPWNEDEHQCRDVIWGYCRRVNVTLANGQRVIVRGLSEDRKAARAAKKAADRACYESSYAQALARERDDFYGKGKP